MRLERIYEITEKEQSKFELKHKGVYFKTFTCALI